MKSIIINPKILKYYFDDKSREMCKSCKRWGQKQTCPPYVEIVAYYKNVLPKYKHGVIYYEAFQTDQENWKEQGKQTSLKIHKLLLNERDRLFSDGHYFVVCYGAGSCKWCETCQIPCRCPNKAIVPLEATGINVVKLMKRFNIKVTFPIINDFYRIGIVLYD